MKDFLQHEGFIGSVHYSAADNCFFGKIEGIEDLITFEGQDVEGIKIAFIEAAADYKTLCIQADKLMHKSYKGSFNVRIAPELHKKAVQKSLMLGISLNQLVQKAIEEEVKNISVDSQ
ncbi:type II toxin-antitoxin system HicB family antitoxin [Acidobacteriota bacterium]